MALIGFLGDILFTVSSEKIQTFNKIQWFGSVRYSTHKRHLSNALTEFTGIEPDKISFEMTLSRDMGVSTMTELVKIWTYERNGQPLTLVIGEKAYGKYKWCIESHKINMETYDKSGNLTSATVSVNLLEYLA